MRPPADLAVVDVERGVLLPYRFGFLCQVCQPAGTSAGAESSSVTATVVAVTAARSAAPRARADDDKRLRRLGAYG
ncbi:hypothetical protein ACFY5C_13605 [Streptomyces sp. NPDC012935]|uniref:hypothetical protein n=1 Tax=Streptomyces sp. NPDC012935 TaxID=3364857 RepID=UPI0036B7959F